MNHKPQHKTTNRRFPNLVKWAPAFAGFLTLAILVSVFVGSVFVAWLGVYGLLLVSGIYWLFNAPKKHRQAKFRGETLPIYFSNGLYHSGHGISQRPET